MHKDASYHALPLCEMQIEFQTLLSFCANSYLLHNPYVIAHQSCCNVLPHKGNLIGREMTHDSS